MMITSFYMYSLLKICSIINKCTPEIISEQCHTTVPVRQFQNMQIILSTKVNNVHVMLKSSVINNSEYTYQGEGKDWK